MAQPRLPEEERIARRKASHEKWKAKKLISDPTYFQRKVEENRETINANARKRRAANPEKHAEYQRQWLKDNPGKSTEYCYRWLEKNPGYRESYYQSHKENYLERARKSHSKRKDDPAYRLLKIIRCRLAKEIRKASGRAGVRVSKTATTEELLGCSIPSLMLYLESKWEPGMSWDNYGVHGWHVDHEMPMAMFSIENPEHQRIACHFTNLQPMWASENLKKHAKIPNTSVQLT